MKKQTRKHVGLGLLLGLVSISMPLNASTKLGEKDCNCNKPVQVNASVKPTAVSSAKAVKEASKSNTKAI